MRTYLGLFLLVIGMISYGQNIEKRPLVEILESIENQYQVKFSYAPEDVLPISIESPKLDLELLEVIDYLNANTPLKFRQLDNRYVTVSKADKTISICGYVLTKVDEAPLLGASVYIKDTSIGTITNEHGYFELNDIPVSSDVLFSFLGYHKKVIKSQFLFSKKNDCKRIVLDINNEALTEVVLTKFLTTGVEKLIDGRTVLNSKAFGLLPGLIEPDVLQSIQTLPGIESANESIANINVRGGTNDQNLILWDGIKMYHSGHFFGLISAYNPNLTEKVYVTKNGTSSQYSDGVSSTIDMRTKNELNRKFTGGVGANLISGDAFLEIPVAKNLEFHISGRRSFTDAFKTFAYNNYFERSFQDSDIRTKQASSDNISTTSNFKFYDYTAKVLYNLNERHKFRINFIEINNDLEYTERSQTESDDIKTKTSNLSQYNTGIGGVWQAAWSSRFNTQLNAYYSKYNVDAEDYNVESNQLLTQANEVIDTGVKFNSNLSLNDNFKWLNGYQFNETGILNETRVTIPSYYRINKDVLRNHALYSEIELLSQNAFIRAGARLNYFEKFNRFLLEPRLNIRYSLTKLFSLKLEGEFKNQSATQIFDFTDDFLGVEKRRWILANESSIPISQSQQASFGGELNKKNLNISLAGFYKNVHGITARNQGFYNNFQSLRAIGEYTARGVEFLFNKTEANYSTWFSYTYAVNEYKFELFTPSVFPNNIDIRHSVTVGLNYDILNNLKVSLGGTLRSGLPFTKPVEGNETIQSGNNVYVNYDTPNRENLEAFKRVDMSVSYNVKLTSNVAVLLKAGVLNLTNAQNVVNRYYKVNPEDTSTTIEVNNTSLRMTPNLSLRVMF
ncbi:TonB-dependent receptor [Aestuariibaculum sediminum]|uniref:TonB-dependent receptor n=2 Tax=Bacteria TaxID=2 RepID=A0A8J6UCC5_9FLAO|nr:carboxypeptidase-like regulatory domain-containing protein [Aestuariibaculum sediminum]MBD0832259.1 TonB-dependent receptor [Aestuariibaculum sediminum]